MASLESTFNELFDMGTQNITVGRPNDKERVPGVDWFAKTAFGCATGGPGNGVMAEVCGAGGDLPEAINNLRNQIAGLKKFESKPSGVLIPGKHAENGARLKLS